MNERKDVFQDEFTENQSKYEGAKREDVATSKKLDPNVDSQEGDEAMTEGRFERDNTKP